MQRNAIRTGIRSRSRIALTRSLRTPASSPELGRTLHLAPLPLAIILFLWLTSSNSVTWPQVFLSLLLLQTAWGAWVSWKFKPGKKDFPVFASIAAMFWMAYGLPLYWSRTESWRFSGGYVTTHGVIRAQALALLALAAIYAGMHLGLGKNLRARRTLEVRDAGSSVKYLVLLLTLGGVIRLRPEIVVSLGAAFRQVLMILFTVVPMVAYAILLRRSLMRPVALYERVLLVMFVAGTFLLGLSTGWVGTGASIIVVTGCVLIEARQSIPKLALVGVFAYILFLQPAKEQFREVYWYGGSSNATNISRAADWISMSRTIWQSELASSDGEGLRHHLYGVINRFSLLQQTANVLDLTPELVPYQGWKMYTYMATALIPRAIWKDKPTINEANRLYQVVYGITPERALEGVSISVGILAESYISFGWFGAVVVMTLIGIVLDCFGSLMLSCNSGTLSKGIGFALLPGFVVLESQMAQYLGGLVQNVALSVLVLLPIAQVSGSRSLMPRPRRGAIRKPPMMQIPAADTTPVVLSK